VGAIDLATVDSLYSWEMLFFGHTGITLDVAWLVDEISLRRARRHQPEEGESAGWTGHGF
jgi:hypothetical protein